MHLDTMIERSEALSEVEGERKLDHRVEGNNQSVAPTIKRGAWRRMGLRKRVVLLMEDPDQRGYFWPLMIIAEILLWGIPAFIFADQVDAYAKIIARVDERIVGLITIISIYIPVQILIWTLTALYKWAKRTMPET